MKKNDFIAMILLVTVLSTFAQQKRFRDYGWEIGVLKTGRYNAITDVEGLIIGHTTKTSRNEAISPLFLATIEATEEAIISTPYLPQRLP